LSWGFCFSWISNLIFIYWFWQGERTEICRGWTCYLILYHAHQYKTKLFRYSYQLTCKYGCRRLYVCVRYSSRAYHGHQSFTQNFRQPLGTASERILWRSSPLFELRDLMQTACCETSGCHVVVSWDMTPCSLLPKLSSFTGACCINSAGYSVAELKIQRNVTTGGHSVSLPVSLSSPCWACLSVWVALCDENAGYAELGKGSNVQGDQKSLCTWLLQYKKHAKIF
jgi:hypothetical protein